MKLAIEQRIFSWKDRFTIRDDAGRDRYYVEGELISWGKQLHVTNTAGVEVAYIEEEIFSFLPRYRVYVGDRQIAEVERAFSFFRHHYTVDGVDGLNWDVQGDLWSHEFTVTRNGVSVASISKEWFTWGDCYALDILDPADELQALALVLAIDCAIDRDTH